MGSVGAVSFSAPVDIDGDGAMNGFEVFLGIVILAGILITTGYVFAKLFNSINGTMKRFNQFFEDWHGEEGREVDGIPERPGVMKRIATLEEDRQANTDTLRQMKQTVDAIAKKVDAELAPNHGTSMKDGINVAVNLAGQALGNVLAVRDTQESQAELLKAWQDKYEQDQGVTRDEWVAVFEAVRKMIHMPPEQQAEVWDQITTSYANGTIAEKEGPTA